MAKPKTINLRDRKGITAFTDEEVLAELYEIRDGALLWMKDCVVEASNKGAGTAQLLFEKNSREIDQIRRRMETGDGSEPRRLQMNINGIDIEVMDFGNHWIDTAGTEPVHSGLDTAKKGDTSV